MARNDLMTALLDTRRALEEQVTALGERVETSRREVIETVTSKVSDLHADNRETRNRVNNASTSASETNKSLPGLRQDVADLVRTVHDLRTMVSGLVACLPDAPAVSPASSSDPASPSHDQAPSEQPDRDVPAGTGLSQEQGTTASTETDNTAAAPPSEHPEAGVGAEEAVQRWAAIEAVSGTRPNEEESAGGPSAPGTNAAPRDNDLGDELAKHDNVLATAATVGIVHLVCHRDMWDFIQERAADMPHFRAPAAPAEEGHDRLRVTLSGRSVIGVLIAMRETQLKNAKYGKDDGTWALSGTVYRRLAHDLTTTSRSGTLPLTVVFDDGISAGSKT